MRISLVVVKRDITKIMSYLFMSFSSSIWSDVFACIYDVTHGVV